MYTYIMQRTQIYLAADEAAALDQEARRSGHTRSHLIREAIRAKYLPSDRTDDEFFAVLDAAFGAWRDRPFTGAEYTERMRPGRIHRRLIERDRLRDEDRRR